MNKFKRRLMWFSIAFILQQFIFLCVENVYLGTDLNIKAEKVQEKENLADKKTEIDIKSGLNEVKLSADGRFVSYLEDNKLKVLDSNDNKEKECQTDETSYVKSIEELKNVENFNQGTTHNALKHIFEGEIDLKTGKAIGFHYEGFTGCRGKIVGNLEEANDFGVYRANIEVDGVLKNAKTTFFPQKYTPQEVIDATNEAFAKKEVLKNNIYRGTSESGMEIEFVIKKGKIDSAYPVY